MMRLILFWLMALSIMSCRFDADSQYIPATQQAYILGKQQENGRLEMLRIEKNQLSRNWEENWPELGGEISDFSGREEFLWVGSGNEKKILEISLESEALLRSISTNEISPHYICAGNRYVLISDTLTSSIALFNRKAGSWISTSLDSMPGEAFYVDPVFYVGIGEKGVLLYHETALAPLTEVQLDRPLKGLDFDSQELIFCFTQTHIDSPLYQNTINVNSYEVWDQSIRTEFKKIRYSPYDQLLYGTEWIFRTRQYPDGRLLPQMPDRAIDFEMDFFEQRYYYLKEDSFYTYSLASEDKVNLGAFTGTLLKSFFYVAPSDE